MRAPGCRGPECGCCGSAAPRDPPGSPIRPHSCKQVGLVSPAAFVVFERPPARRDQLRAAAFVARAVTAPPGHWAQGTSQPGPPNTDTNATKPGAHVGFGVPRLPSPTLSGQGQGGGGRRCKIRFYWRGRFVSSGRGPCPLQGGSNEVLSMVPSKPNCSTILWHGAGAWGAEQHSPGGLQPHPRGLGRTGGMWWVR